MKRFLVVFVALLLIGVLGCDGDGDGAVDSTEPTDVPDTGPEPVVVDRGTATVPPFASRMRLSSFSVTETGTLQGRLRWSAGPAVLTSTLVLNGFWVIEMETGSSSLFVSAEVTQDLLNMGNDWLFYVSSSDSVGAEVEYRVRFTPDN